jgi:signal transduction histidine kinase
MTGNILIASDTAEILGELSAILSDHPIRTVERGAEVLMVGREDRPALILLDLVDNHTVCEQLKSDPASAAIPVIVVARQDTDLTQLFQFGSTDYVSQPLCIEEVRARVNMHLTLHRQGREIAGFSEAKDRMVRTISHDVKNAIGVVAGYADLLVDESASQGDSGESRTHYYAMRVQKGVKHLLALVTSLIDVVRVEEQIGLTVTPIALPALLRECVAEARLLAQRKQLKFAVDSLPDLTLHVDAERISQALRNLLSNAIKFTPEGGHIELSIVLQPEEVIFRIKDSGLGIPEVEIPRLFRKFHRVNRKGYAELEGAGLGLYLAKAIVEFHGGRIWAESEPGAGSTFSIALPLEARSNAGA